MPSVIYVLGGCNNGACTVRTVDREQLAEWEQLGYKYISRKALDRHIRYHMHRANRSLGYYIDRAYTKGYVSLEIEKGSN